MAIQKGDLLMDLMNLVNIPSVSDTDCKEVPFGRECQRALKWMLDRGTEFGFMGTDYDGYAGSLSLNGEEKTNPEAVTGIWCHLDVVPAGEAGHQIPLMQFIRTAWLPEEALRTIKPQLLWGCIY